MSELIDQKKLAEDIASKITLTLKSQFLVKPLPPTMVKKKVSTPIPAPEKDQKGEVDGVKAVDYNEVKEEIKEMESRYKRGVVIKVPTEYLAQQYSEIEAVKIARLPIEVGDIIVYNYGAEYDLLKDSQLVSNYDIVAVEK